MYLLDTCTLSDFFKHIDPALNQKILSIPPKHFFISAISVDEVEYGLARQPAKAEKYRPLFELFLKQITPSHVLPVDAKMAAQAGKLRALLSTTGIVLEQYDLLIAVTALYHEMTVVSSNVKHFVKVPNLKLEDWRKHGTLS